MRKFRKLTVPPRAHPLVRRMFAEMNRQHVGVLDLSERAGIGRSTLKHWRTMHSPSLVNLEACFAVLGLKLRIVCNDNE